MKPLWHAIPLRQKQTYNTLDVMGLKCKCFSVSCEMTDFQKNVSHDIGTQQVPYNIRLQFITEGLLDTES